MGISGYEFNHEAMVWLELFRTSLRTWHHEPVIPWVLSGLVYWSLLIKRPYEYRKITKMWISSRMLASSSSAPVWRICMSFTTLGMQSKSQDPWLLDDFLQRHQYKNAATLMTRNGIQKRSAFGTSYSVLKHSLGWQPCGIHIHTLRIFISRVNGPSTYSGVHPISAGIKMAVLLFYNIQE